MVEDFNNVQDQNLVDDDVVSQITGDSAATAGGVGSVVHPDDPKPASQTPPVPTAQELLGDKIDEAAASAAEPINLPEPADVPEPDIEVPTPEIAPEAITDEGPDEEEQASDGENLIAPPAAAPPPDDSNADSDDDSSDEPDDTNEEDEPAGKPKLDTSHLDGGTGDDDELEDVKHEALEELSPLLSHLDLPPEQKFDTYMEILRASDDKTLVKPALEAAKAIEDDDKRAQALLDVVNEVNYLTQSHGEE